VNTDKNTKLFGVFGDPVAHSLSPAMHNRAFEALGYHGVYLPFHVKHIEPAVAAVRTLGIRGVSVTLPHKVSVMAHLDRLDPLAEQIGAVNTIVNTDGILMGYNTDCFGAVSALMQHTDIKGKTVAVIGAGGAARAIGWGVKDAGANVTVVNRSSEKGEQLAKDLSTAFIPLNKIEALAADIIVNTTPVGMHPHTADMPVPAGVFREGLVVMDIVYTPLKTAFLKKARQAGCTMIDGLSMFVLQGARQLELWTGLEAPVDVMQEAVIEQLGTSA
jgi:shikimate dehydrogenase